MNHLLRITQAWQNAVNQNDAEQLLKLSSPNIEIVGPKGSAHGHQILIEWLFRAGLQFTPKRYFALSQTLVVLQQAVWHDVETKQPISRAEVASVFGILNDTVHYYARYDTLEEAFASSAMGLQNEISATEQ